MAILEVCAGSLASARAAAQGGAARIELCASLEKDGLTPELETIKEARKIPGLRVHVLIRSREGDFVYTEEDILLMERQIRKARELGVDGVVFGALTPEGEVDINACRRLALAANPEGCPQKIHTTFHRAFDKAADPLKALEDIISLGCDRILTSGQKPSAQEGVELLKVLNKKADGRVIIMPGAGVNASNAADILRQSGCKEIHSSARADRNDTDTNPAVVAAINSSIHEI